VLPALSKKERIMRIGICLASACLVFISMLAASLANAEQCHVNVDRTQTFTTSQDKYVVRLQGYAPTDLVTTYINPFPQPNSAVASVDTDGSTIITFSGSGLLPPLTPPAVYHFGYILNNCPETPHGSAAPGTKDEYWSPSGVTTKKSVPNAIIRSTGGTTPKFAVVYVSTLDSSLQSVRRRVGGKADHGESERGRTV
jgi:hypothetical protein